MEDRRDAEGGKVGGTFVLASDFMGLADPNCPEKLGHSCNTIRRVVYEIFAGYKKRITILIQSWTRQRIPSSPGLNRTKKTALSFFYILPCLFASYADGDDKKREMTCKKSEEKWWCPQMAERRQLCSGVSKTQKSKTEYRQYEFIAAQMKS